MKKAIIVIKLKPKQFSKILVLAEGVHDSMLLNPHFPSPQPSLAAIKTGADELRELLALWGIKGNRGSHMDYVMMAVKADTLLVLLTQLGEWCMSSLPADMPFGDQAVVLSSTGFRLKGAKTPQGPLEAVQDLRRFFARNVKEWQVKLAWVKPLNVANSINVKGYVIYRSQTPVFSSATIIDVVSKTSYIDEPGSGTWYYWIRPMNSKGQGVVSETLIARIAVGF